MGSTSPLWSCAALAITLCATRAVADSPRDMVFEAGVALQAQGKNAEALDAFRRAYRTSPTPISLLHIAECEIALNRLVKAESHLQMLSDATIAEGSPPEFYDAQIQGRRELAEISPRVRVATITITVSEPNAKGLSVTIDEWPLDGAQLGVPQRVDPGAHAVLVSARNRAPMAATIVIADGQSLSAPLTVGPYMPTEYPSSEQLSPGLVAGGVLITVLSGIAVASGGLYLFGEMIMLKDSREGTEIASGFALGGLATAAVLGVPMIIIGKLRVRPTVTVSARAVGLGLSF